MWPLHQAALTLIGGDGCLYCSSTLFFPVEVERALTRPLSCLRPVPVFGEYSSAFIFKFVRIKKVVDISYICLHPNIFCLYIIFMKRYNLVCDLAWELFIHIYYSTNVTVDGRK